jgi:hypothetical protein
MSKSFWNPSRDDIPRKGVTKNESDDDDGSKKLAAAAAVPSGPRFM